MKSAAGVPVALSNDDMTASYPTMALGPDRNAFVVWTAAGEKSSSAVLVRGRWQ